MDVLSSSSFPNLVYAPWVIENSFKQTRVKRKSAEYSCQFDRSTGMLKRWCKLYVDFLQCMLRFFIGVALVYLQFSPIFYHHLTRREDGT